MSTRLSTATTGPTGRSALRHLCARSPQPITEPDRLAHIDIRRCDRLGGVNVGAIVYHNKVVYSVFADVGPESAIGEASYATATALGINPDPTHGGISSGVTYIVFPGQYPDAIERSAINQVGAVAAAAFARR